MDVGATEAGGDADGRSRCSDDGFDADFGEFEGDGFEVVGVDAAELDFAAGDGGGDGEGAGLDAVGDHPAASAAEAVDAVDFEPAGADAGDARAHGVEHVGEAGDFGLGGGVDDDGAAGGEDGGHEHVLGAGDGGVVEPDEPAGEGAVGAGEGGNAVGVGVGLSAE